MNTKNRAVPRKRANFSDQRPNASESYDGFKLLRASRGYSREFLFTFFFAMIILPHFLSLKIQHVASFLEVNGLEHHRQ